jgi:transposase InsO family protein
MLASKFGRYGYRRVTGLLHNAGWQVNPKRVERIWRAEGLKVPNKQPKRGRLWFNDGSCVRLRAEYPGHVWSYDFVADRTHDGKALRTLNIIDEFTRECLQIRVERNLKREDVQECLTELFCQRGVPAHIRSDNGSEFCNAQIRAWLNELAVRPLFIEPGSPWENGFIGRFDGKFRDELLNRETFYTLKEAKSSLSSGARSKIKFVPPLPKRYCCLNLQLRCSPRWPSLPLFNWTDQRGLVKPAIAFPYGSSTFRQKRKLSPGDIASALLPVAGVRGT